MKTRSPSSRRAQGKFPAALKIVGIYLTIGCLWIFFSDRLLEHLLHSPEEVFTSFQTLKGCLYVLTTAALLYGLIDRETRISRNTTQKLKYALAELEATQDALKQSEMQFRTFMDNSPASSWVTDVQGKMEYASHTYLQMFQVPSDLIGQTVFDLYPQDIAQTYLDNIQAVVESGRILEAIEPGIRSDGQLGQFLVYKFPLPQPDGTTYVGGVAIDVTERQQTEAQLRERERFFSTLAEVAPVTIFRFDATNHCSYVTDRWIDLTGRSVASALGMGWVKSLHPDDRERLAQAWLDWSQNARQRGLYQNEGRCLHLDGRVLWYDIQALPEIDAQGEIVGYVGVLTDITYRKQAEAALQESQRQLQHQLAEIETIYQSAPIGLAVLNQSFRYIRLNQQLAEIDGVSIAEHLGRTVREVVPHLADYLESLYRQVLQTGEPILNLEINGETNAQPGMQRTWIASYYPLKDQIDQPIGINAVVQEITDRKQMEEQLRFQERLFRQAIVDAPYPMMLHAEDGQVVQVNQIWTELTGYEASQIPTIADWVEKAYGQRMEPIRAGIDRLYSLNEKVYEGEFTPRTKDGQERIWDFSSAPIGRLLDGRRLVLSMAVDVTNRKQLEQTLRQQAERLKLISTIAQRIRQSLNVKDILNTTVVEVKQLLHVDRVIVYQFAPDMSGTIVAESVAPGWRVSLNTVIVDTCFQTGAGEDYRQGRIQAIANVEQAGLTDCHLQLLQQFEVKANLIVPILLRGTSEATSNHLWGLLVAHQCTSPRNWHGEQLELLNQIALQLAIAIQQAQIYEQAQTELLERQQAEAHLRVALTEKEVLLKEIHHRVKNNLQIVSGLLQLQAQDLDDPRIVKALQESQHRIESMSLIHKKLYTSSNLGQIDVADYIQSLATNLLMTYQLSPSQVTLETEIEPIALSLDHAIPCGLIINELVSNALKYAFPNNLIGELKIKLCVKNTHIELIIQDNGVGLPAHIDLQNVQSLGLSLVYALSTDQLDGSITVDRNQGTQYTIEFPQTFPKK